MKKLLLFFIFITYSFSMEEGEILYSSCKFCHGNNAEKIYMNAVPAIKDLDIDSLTKKLKAYKEGTLNDYGFGQIMKQQMANIPNEKILTLSKYIKNL